MRRSRWRSLAALLAGPRGRATLLCLTGLLLACARAAPPPRSPAPPTAEGQGAPAPPLAQAEPPPAPPRAESPALPPVVALRVPHRVRIGLQTDLDRVQVPCCEGALVVAAGGVTVAMAEPLVVEPAARHVGAPRFRLQVAALKDESQARRLADQLAAATGQPGDVVFDAGTDLYRVRLGSFASREEADAGRRALAQRNVHDAWVVGEQGALRDPALRIRQGGREHQVKGRWLEIQRTEGEGIRIAGGRYRGRILVYLNDRGRLNLVNEVTLDDYLRGVVPREMGPAIYDNVEALKAQTVAARTYALKNLGEFTGEGYDICATPRCQVYGGMDSEHELTDRAIAETSGEVLVWHGELVDSLYSSTCGGHTEDVGVIFPLKSEPYLKGVPCLEAGIDRLAGDAPAGAALAAEIMRRLLPPAGGPPEAVLGARLEQLALLAGLAIPADRLRSLERREVQRFIGSLYDLALDARLFVSPADVDYLLGNPPAGWSEEDLRLAAYLGRSGLLSGPVEEPLGEVEVEETLFQLALHLRVLESRSVRYLALGGGRLRFREGSEVAELALPGRLATFRRRGDEPEAGPLGLIPGDRLTAYLRAGVPIGIVQEVDPDGVGYDRTSNLSSWTRFRSDSQLRQRVRERYPDLELADLRFSKRGVSGRVGKLELVATDGRVQEVVGLPVRWTLDVPDTLFTARRLKPPGGESGWLFTGRGWGHGVGMCQVGAYGMSIRGHDYASILHHYYTGVELARVTVVDRASSAGGADVDGYEPGELRP